MPFHGSPPKFSTKVPPSDAETEDKRVLHLDNFCNLFGDASAKDLFQGFGLDKESMKKTRAALQKLARRMEETYDWGDKTSDNENIPAGFTYFGQLAAHDLVQSTAPFPQIGRLHDMRRDLRADRLLLDTIYGGGPETESAAYALPSRGEEVRVRLKMGGIRTPVTGEPGSPLYEMPPADAPLRDIPRVVCPHFKDATQQDERKVWSIENTDAPDVLIADPRNDDSVILSQLTAVFHMLHNSIYDEIAAKESSVDNKLQFHNDSERRFLQARRIVTLLYRRVVEKDYLSRLLDSAVFKLYSEGSANPLKLKLSTMADNKIPLEFSHGAYRMGHMMVRGAYRLNDDLRMVDPFDDRAMGLAGVSDILRTTSARRPGSMPLGSNWLLQWSKFFEIAAEPAVNASRKIGPSIDKSLAGDSLFQSDDENALGLHYLDLVRGAESGLRSVKSIIEILQKKLKTLHPDLIEKSRFLTMDRNAREKEIGSWLNSGRVSFEEDELASLSEDPPLLFFILFEAAVTANGERLGVIGSIILGEVFFGALERTRKLIEGDQITQEWLEKIFEKDVPDSMAKLLEYVADRNGLTSLAKYKFL